MELVEKRITLDSGLKLKINVKINKNIHNKMTEIYHILYLMVFFNKENFQKFQKVQLGSKNEINLQREAVILKLNPPWDLHLL